MRRLIFFLLLSVGCTDPKPGCWHFVNGSDPRPICLVRGNPNFVDGQQICFPTPDAADVYADAHNMRICR